MFHSKTVERIILMRQKIQSSDCIDYRGCFISRKQQVYFVSLLRSLVLFCFIRLQRFRPYGIFFDCAILYRIGGKFIRNISKSDDKKKYSMKIKTSNGILSKNFSMFHSKTVDRIILMEKKYNHRITRINADVSFAAMRQTNPLHP